MVICTKCLVEKNESDFHKDSASKAGIKTVCKSCVSKKMLIVNRRPDVILHRKMYSKKRREERNDEFKAMERNKYLTLKHTEKYKQKIKTRRQKREKRIILATPKCLERKYKLEIKSIYEKARELNLTVDHICPIFNEQVSGLHVPWNLQIISMEQNLLKGNRL